jgi:hypothetical protein
LEHTGEIKNVYKYLIRKPTGKKALGRLRHIWKNNIKKDVTEIWCEYSATTMEQPVTSLRYCKKSH